MDNLKKEAEELFSKAQNWEEIEIEDCLILIQKMLAEIERLEKTIKE